MLVQSQSDTYSNFIDSITSDVTKKTYEYNLRLFMECCSVHKYEDLIGKENKIIPYLMSLREKKLSFGRVNIAKINRDLNSETRPNLGYRYQGKKSKPQELFN